MTVCACVADLALKWSHFSAFLVSSPTHIQKIIETGKAWLPFLN